MMQCNIEIFDAEGRYRDSIQLVPKTHKVDYLTPPKNSIQLPKDTMVYKGDWIFFCSGKTTFWGIVSGVQEGSMWNTASYSDFLNVFDMNVYANAEELNEKTVEQWIADIITSTFVNNVDTVQNIKGMRVVCDTQTKGALEFDKNVSNLLKDIMYVALTKYNIVLEPVINRANNNVELHVRRKDSRGICIEADLPNVLTKKITIGEGKANKNKITIIHKEDESERYTFYMLENGTVTEDENEDGRIAPVISDTVLLEFTYKEPKEGEEPVTFHDKAVTKAEQSLVTTKYNNLIEITVGQDDEILNDINYSIGEEFNIISDGNIYASVLTGYEIADRTKLIFGSIRDEFTKILRRMLR